MVHYANMLIDGMDITESGRHAGVVAWAKSEDVLGKTPVISCICITYK